MDDEHTFLRRKVVGQVHGRVCDEAAEGADVGSRGAEKRRRLEPDTEPAVSGSSGSPRRAAPAAGGSATSESSRVAAFGDGEAYEDICHLATGTYGIVTKARHRATGRTVAIKFLVPDGGDDEEVQADALREARLLEACGGVPFVVGFHELVRYPACPDLYLVMECGGPSIAGFLSEQGGGTPAPLPEPTLRAVMWQLLTAAEGMHARGVIHRDIKPDNVLVAEDLRAVKICDFGLAMSTSERPPYEPAGTPGYMAPEILLELPEYDGRVDTWSLGCVMAEVLAGRPLFETISGEPEKDLLRILRVLGVPNDETWPGFLDTPFATKRWKELNLQQPNVLRLRELIPESMLSKEGFEVLSGLLVCNPDNRLTAAAALNLPWFADKDTLELLPKKAEAALTLPKEKWLALF